jgi:hypothetical protein
MPSVPGTLDDHEFQTPDSDSGPRPTSPRRAFFPIVVMAIGLIAVVSGVYLYVRRSPEPSPPPAAAATAPAPTAPAPVVDDRPRYDLPPLDDSDPFMRDRLAELSGHSLLAAWSRGTGLARNLVGVLDSTSRGLTPSQHLRALRPGVGFRVIERGTRIVLDPRNYQRFTPLAEAAASIDAGAAAKVYAGIKPLLQMAYDELGNQEPIDRALERAVRQVLSAPVVEGDVPLQIGGAGIGYRFADPSLESLPAAQKQLIRMGPENQRRIQEQVRLFAAAAGIPH